MLCSANPAYPAKASESILTESYLMVAEDFVKKFFVVNQSLEMGHIPIDRLHTLKKELETFLDADLTNDENYVFRIDIHNYNGCHLVSPLVLMFLSEDISRSIPAWPAVYSLESGSQSMNWQVLVIPNAFRRLRDYTFRPQRGLMVSDDRHFDMCMLEELHDVRISYQVGIAPDSSFLTYMETSSDHPYISSISRHRWSEIVDGKYPDKAVVGVVEEFVQRDDWESPVKDPCLAPILQHITQ